MKIGITQLVVPGTLDEVIRKAVGWGYEALELGMRAEGGLLNLATSDEEKREMGRRVRGAGLEMASIVASPVGEFPLFHPDGDVRARGVERCRLVLQTARLLGAETILLVPGRLTGDIFYDEALERLSDSLQRLVPIAAEAGVNIGVENVWNRFLVSPMDMKAVLDRVDSPWVGAYIDTGNMVFWNYPQHWIRILARHIRKIHFKDFRRDKMTLDFCPLMKGEVDWAAVMREIRRAGYAGPVISEVGGDDALMAETVRTMRVILAIS